MKRIIQIKLHIVFLSHLNYTETQLILFWYAVKYEYEGEKQRIVPLVINQFIEILMILIKIKKNKKELTHIKIEVLFNEIIQSSNNFQKSEYWIAEIPTIIKNWGEQVVN